VGIVYISVSALCVWEGSGRDNVLGSIYFSLLFFFIDNHVTQRSIYQLYIRDAAPYFLPLPLPTTAVYDAFVVFSSLSIGTGLV
jgi:hypothetical protein